KTPYLVVSGLPASQARPCFVFHSAGPYYMHFSFPVKGLNVTSFLSLPRAKNTVTILPAFSKPLEAQHRKDEGATGLHL
ncbi:MAG: hypothetical protein ACOYYS_27875, partial [Chloroflexota bacterium]